MIPETLTHLARSRMAPLILGLVAVVAFLDTFAIVPFLATYASSLGATKTQAGWIVGLYSLANLLANFASGWILDRWGRRIPMVVSLLCASALIGLYAIVDTPLELMLLRVLHGATGAVFVPALFAVSGEYGGTHRTRTMGLIGALIGLVAVVAPPISGIIIKAHGAEILFYTVSLLTALAGLSVLGLYEFAPVQSRLPAFAFRTLWRSAGVAASLWLTLGMTFAMGVQTVALPLEMETAGYNAAYCGRIWGLFALVSVVWMALVRSRHAFGGVLVRASLGVGLLACGLLTFAGLPLPAGAWLWAVLGGVGFGLAFPAVHLLAFEGAPESMRGSALAVLHAFYSLGYVMGPGLAGWLTAYALSGWIGGLLTFAMLEMAWHIGHHHPTK